MIWSAGGQQESKSKVRAHAQGKCKQAGVCEGVSVVISVCPALGHDYTVRQCGSGKRYLSLRGMANALVGARKEKSCKGTPCPGQSRAG